MRSPNPPFRLFKTGARQLAIPFLLSLFLFPACLSFPVRAQATIGGEGSGIVNILLVGQDRRDGEPVARSDSMILCTFHKESKRLVMTSFLRDLYVQIPGCQPNRINAAYAAGGVSLLNKTLTQNFGIHIDGNVEIDFSQFSGIIDLLGGVRISLRADEARVITKETGYPTSEGLQLLNGEQALAYSRIRKLDRDGDFSRTDRQRKVIRALLDAYRNLPKKELLPLVTKLLPLINTDMSTPQLLLCAMDILPLLSQVEIISQRIPAEGTYTHTTVDGMSVLSADMNAARRMLEQTLLGN